MKHITNATISCMYCGASVAGVESSTKTYNGVLYECQWNCPRCYQVARHEEEFIKDED